MDEKINIIGDRHALSFCYYYVLKNCRYIYGVAHKMIEFTNISLVQYGTRIHNKRCKTLLQLHSPSEDHYGNVTWNNFNLATELPRIPTPVSSPGNNPHQLTVFQNNQGLRPCHHLPKLKHLTRQCLSMEDTTLGGHHARGSLDSCMMLNEHF